GVPSATPRTPSPRTTRAWAADARCRHLRWPDRATRTAAGRREGRPSPVHTARARRTDRCARARRESAQGRHRPRAPLRSRRRNRSPWLTAAARPRGPRAEASRASPPAYSRRLGLAPHLAFGPWRLGVDVRPGVAAALW